MKSNDCATTACKASSYQPRVTLWVIVTGRAMRPARAEAQTVDQAFALALRARFSLTKQDPGRCPGL